MRLKLTKFLLVKSLVLVASGAAMVPYPADSALPPVQVGRCANTSIQRIGTRLTDSSTGNPIPGSGTHVELTNGIYLVAYEEQLKTAHTGDEVKLCLVHIPENCPPGDNRGRVYSLLNYRTKKYVEMSDSQHVCGGA